MNNERFVSYIERLKKGEAIEINAFIYGDFLRYVQFVGGDTLKLFEEKFNSKPSTSLQLPYMKVWLNGVNSHVS